MFSPNLVPGHMVPGAVTRPRHTTLMRVLLLIHRAAEMDQQADTVNFDLFEAPNENDSTSLTILYYSKLDLRRKENRNPCMCKILFQRHANMKYVKYHASPSPGYRSEYALHAKQMTEKTEPLCNHG